MQDFIVWNWPFAVAAALMGFAFLLHLIIGGRQVARPLLKTTSLQLRVQMTLYYVWHIVSAGLLALTLVLLAAALRPEWVVIGWAAGLMAALLAIVSLAQTVFMRLPWTIVPQWMIFAPIAALAIWGATR